MNGPKDELQIVRRAVARLRASIMAVTFAGVGGVGLFVATIWLVIQGGQVVGPTLGRLGNYLPGYDVSVGGAFLGLFYGGWVGGVVGYSVAWIYNSVALRRGASS
ncbi:MAG: hypothetical protein HY791_15455 [Deltaproteobacteria bacterium]|nr:hypothetical protein [Deltaproteobacteria bacterium]